MAREGFKATPRDRQQMHEISGSDDLPELVTVDLDGDDPNAFTDIRPIRYRDDFVCIGRIKAEHRP